MKPSLTFSLAAIAAAASMTAGAVVMHQAPTWKAESEYSFAQAPVASALNPNNEDEMGLVKPIVEALNQDQSLKMTKITVSADKGLVTLTGTAPTQDDVKRIIDIATAKAGAGNVVNVIQPAKINYQTAQEQAGMKKLADMPDETISG